ncbi:hypothetical protein F7725_021309, partial [Dissostichus mawsoni]
MMASGALRGGGRAAETRWRRHIVGQLKLRDRRQHDKFQDLIRFYTRLLEKTSLTPARRPSSDSSLSALLHQNNQLKNTTGELAYQVVQLQQQIKIKDSVLDEQHARQQQEEPLLQGAGGDSPREMGALKSDYDALLERQRGAETKLREEKLRGGNLLQEVIHLKQQEAANMNTRNERRCRAREAARSKVTVETRSASSPRILTSIRALFQLADPQSDADGSTEGVTCIEFRPQGPEGPRRSYDKSLCCGGWTPRSQYHLSVSPVSITCQYHLSVSPVCLTCLSLTCHLTCLSNLSVSPVCLTCLAHLSVSPVCLTCLSHLSVSPVTLTGHSRRVTAARFGLNLQVVTGSADRTVRLWDLQRACCVQVVEVPSYCSDLICTGAVRCIQELPAHGKVTSLDISPDHRHLLSCCRDDCLQLIDLRGGATSASASADGFKCGSDSTKAVISPDGCFLAAGSADGAVYIWNVSTGNLETRLPDKHSSSISAVSWSPSGEYVVSVDLSRRAVLWR